MTTEDFLRRTKGDFERLAAGLLNDYRRRGHALPADVGVEDVANRMRVEALRAVGKWQPTRGVALASFVIFAARSKPRKWINQRRGCVKDSQPTRAPMLLADLFEPDADEERVSAFAERKTRAAGGGWQPVGQEEAHVAAEMLRRLRELGVEADTVDGAVDALRASRALREVAARAFQAEEAA